MYGKDMFFDYYYQDFNRIFFVLGTNFFLFGYFVNNR